MVKTVSCFLKNWRWFLDEVRTLYEQNPQDFED